MTTRTVGIEPGDLFLFFGWFHRVEEDVNGGLRYVRRSGDFYSDKAKKFPWHPHAAENRQFDENDYIFAASKSLSFAPSMPGAGILPFAKERVLTMNGAQKATWKPNPVYMPNAIVGNRKNSARGDGVFYSGVWQELGLKETKASENWAKKMVLI